MSFKVKKILVTGCAGFIGFHLCMKLIKRKYDVYGLDNLNNYYDLNLKKDRLKILKKNILKFFKYDLLSKNQIDFILSKKKIDIVIHLAAQAGVRYSIKNPKTYLDNNIQGCFNILDSSQKFKIKHFIYASTSSVYGFQKKMPFVEKLSTDKPLSFYAATKKCNEILAYSYSTIHKLPTTGLRFFTVYGPFGRPDMSLFKFANAILRNRKLDLYNHGNHSRDFTHIDDITEYIFKILDKKSKKKVPYQIFNLARSKREKLKTFIKFIELEMGKQGKYKLFPLQKGDVKDTYASVHKISKITKYKPKVSLQNGIKDYINWFKNYY